MVITQESARSPAALKRPVAADVRTPREQQDEPLVLPARSPNLNAYAERWVRSVKEECPSKVILFGERSLRRALSEYVEHFHAERNHQAQSFAHVTRFSRRRARLSEQSRNRSMSHYPARPGGCAGRKISANCKWVGRSPARSLPESRTSLQLRCTRQLAPAARRFAHNFSALVRLSAPTWTRAQPMLPRASPW